jgi:hypothetical protein
VTISVIPVVPADMFKAGEGSADGRTAVT